MVSWYAYLGVCNLEKAPLSLFLSLSIAFSKSSAKTKGEWTTNFTKVRRGKHHHTEFICSRFSLWPPHSIETLSENRFFFWGNQAHLCWNNPAFLSSMSSLYDVISKEMQPFLQELEQQLCTVQISHALMDSHQVRRKNMPWPSKSFFLFRRLPRSWIQRGHSKTSVWGFLYADSSGSGCCFWIYSAERKSTMRGRAKG